MNSRSLMTKQHCRVDSLNAIWTYTFLFILFFYHSLISLKFEDSVKPSGTFPESFTSCSPAPHPTTLRDNKDAADQVSLIVWRSVQLYLVTQSNDSQKQQSWLVHVNKTLYGYYIVVCLRIAWRSRMCLEGFLLQAPKCSEKLL